MTMPGEIRPARPADAAEVRRIVEAAYQRYVARIGKKPGPMLDDYEARIAEGSASVLESADGVIRAVIVLLPKADHLLLDNIAVDPAHHGRGLGRRLLAFADAEARRRGYPEIRLYTHALMHENLAMYPRFGYVEFARVAEAGYDRVYMRKRL
jgi:GNAT superfamily N-acetyltransferase